MSRDNYFFLISSLNFNTVDYQLFRVQKLLLGAAVAVIGGFTNPCNGEYFYVLHSFSISILLIGPIWYLYIKIAGSRDQSRRVKEGSIF